MAKAAVPPPGPTFERVLVGKKEAEELLGVNVHNRNTRDRRVSNYARDMLSDNWLETGDTIKFAKDGSLLDGQHRLLALLRATTDGVQIEDDEILGPDPDLAIWFTIARGLDKKSQEVMDSGATRSLADALHLRGEVNTMRLAAILLKVSAWNAGHRRTIAKQDLATRQTLLELFDSDPEGFRYLTTQVGREYPRIPLPPSVLGLVHYVFEEIDTDDADEFFARLLDGAELAHDHPIYVLRERLRDLKNEPVAKILAMVIKAWNAFRLDEQIQVLGFKMGGKSPETFPDPV